MSRIVDPTTLPDEPNTWSRDLGGFIQAWTPGAFGPDFPTIHGVWSYRVEVDEWERPQDQNAPAQRRILRAVVLERATPTRAYAGPRDSHKTGIGGQKYSRKAPPDPPLSTPPPQSRIGAAAGLNVGPRLRMDASA